MGASFIALVFTEIDLNHQLILEKWVAQLRDGRGRAPVIRLSDYDRRRKWLPQDLLVSKMREIDVASASVLTASLSGASRNHSKTCSRSSLSFVHGLLFGGCHVRRTPQQPHFPFGKPYAGGDAKKYVPLPPCRYGNSPSVYQQVKPRPPRQCRNLVFSVM